MSFREEVLNTYLAYLLEERNLVSLPESVICRGYSVREMPDVLVRISGLRLVIEAKKEVAGAEKALQKKAHARLRSGLAHAVLLVLYPEEFFRESGPAAILQRLERDKFRAALILSLKDLSSPQWFETDLEGLSARLRRLRETVLSEDLIDEAVEIIRGLVGRYQLALSEAPGAEERLSRALGLSHAGDEKRQKIRRILGQKIRRILADIARIAPLVLISALVFQEVLSRTERRVPSILEFEREGDPVLAALSVWEMITREINYTPIFRLSAEVLRISSGIPDFPGVFKDFVEGAYRIAARPAALRHDLMGRLFHLFLSEAKYLGAFYTRIPAAELLLKLAVGLLPHSPGTFFDPEGLRNFSVADLACGTGTLLVAAAEALFDRHLLASAAQRVPANPSAFFKALFEDSLWGYDVVPTALHLTAASLALLAPEVTFRKMNLFCMPLGEDASGIARLGSLEFFRDHSPALQRDLFAALETRQVAEEEVPKYVPLPKLDLCTMNPPFTRSVGGNLLFGNFPEKVRKRLQKELSALIKQAGISASATAGLGALFIALADRYLKPNGIMALVLPKAVLSGPAWAKTRKLLRENYALRCVIVSHDPKAWNFSENTSLSEVLLLAQKQTEDACSAVFVSLWRNLSSPVEAFALAERLEKYLSEKDPPEKPQTTRIFEGSIPLASLILVPPKEVSTGSWGLWTAFAQGELALSAHAFFRGKILWPPENEKPFVSKALGDIAGFGPDRRDLHDGFRLSQTPTDFPTFWNHDTDRVRGPVQEANAWLYPLTEPKPGRPLRKPEDLWLKAARLLLAERLRLNTACVLAVRLPKPVLGNVWWELSGLPEEEEWTFLLWFNTSGGLLTLLAIREETEGAWIAFKKPNLRYLMVPVPRRSLTEEEKSWLSSLKFRSLPEMNKDPARAEADRLAAEVFGIPEEWFAWLRETLPREPVISLKTLA